MTKKKKKKRKKQKKKKSRASARQIAAARRNIKKARVALHHTHKRKKKYARATKVTRGQKRKLRKQNPMARRKKKKGYSKKGSKKLFNMTHVALAVGAGVAGAAGGLVNKYAPNLAGNLAQAAAGGLIYYLTKGFFKNIGLGILIKTGGDVIEDQVMPRITGGSSGW